MTITTIQLREGELELIKKAGELIGLTQSSLLRSATLEKARQILRENNLEVSQS